MSIEAFSWALRVPIGGNAKVILLGLANHAHPDGREAYPVLDTLAIYAHCDRSTARRNVRKLVDEGWIQEDGKGPRGQVKYRLMMSRSTEVSSPEQGLQNATPQKSTGVAPVHEGGGTGAPEGVAPMPPEPSNEPSEEPFDFQEQKTGERESEQLPLLSAPVPDPLRPGGLPEQAEILLAERVRVSSKPVTRRELDCALVALTAWNFAAGQRLTLKPHLSMLVERIREYPAWLPEHFASVVESAWRIRWWEPGDGRKPQLGVVFSPKMFPKRYQDAVDEANGQTVDASYRGKETAAQRQSREADEAMARAAAAMKAKREAA